MRSAQSALVRAACRASVQGHAGQRQGLSRGFGAGTSWGTPEAAREQGTGERPGWHAGHPHRTAGSASRRPSLRRPRAGTRSFFFLGHETFAHGAACSLMRTK